MNSQTASYLKRHLHTDRQRVDKLLLVLDSFSEPQPVSELKKRAIDCGLRAAKNWNVSDSLAKSGGKAVSVPGGWEIADLGREHLESLGLREASTDAIEVLKMQRIAEGIPVEHTRKFVEEAIICLENKAFRAAVVFSWCGAASLLHQYVIENHKRDFNAAGVARFKDGFIKVNKVEHFWRVQESDQLMLFRDIGLVDRGVFRQLKEALDLRNSCAHPGHLSIGESTVAHHLEILILNVFDRFMTA